MATLTGNTVQSTYESLIKIGDNSSGFTTLKQLSDGLGNLMPIKFSSTVVDFQTATDVNFTGVNVIGIPATDTTYDLTSAQSTNDVNLNLVPSTGTTDTIKLIAGTGITLTDNGANSVTIDGSALGVTSLEGLSGALTLNGTQNITVTDNGSNIITLTGYDDSQVTTNTANIATNTTDISNNTGAIATNTTAISQLDADVNTNSTNIATNTANITSNDADILTNAGNIASNTANITNNSNNIATLQAAGYVDTSGSPLSSNVSFFSAAGTITGLNEFSYNTANSRLDLDNISVDDTLTVEENFKYLFPATNNYSGEIATFGSFPAAPNVGRIYTYSSTGFWLAFDSSQLVLTQGILGVAISATEVLLRGMVKTTATYTRGQELWGATNASFTNTQPSGGDYARLMGHACDTNVIYFNPSQEYIETT